MIAIAAILMLSLQSGAGDTWRESAAEQGTVLSFGEAANATIRLTCIRPGVIRADLSGLYTGEGREPRSVVAESGRIRASYRLAYNDGFTVEIPARAAVMQAFGRNARVRFRAAGVELTGDGTPAESPTVAGFLARCRT